MSKHQLNKKPFFSKRKGAGRPEKHAQIVIGTLAKNKRGFGFVIPEDGQGDGDENQNRSRNRDGSPERARAERRDVYIAPSDMNGAMNGDKVEAVILPQEERHTGRGARGDSREGYVHKVIKRGVTEVVGTFEKSKKFGFVVPDNKKLNEDVFILKKDFKGAQRGDKVVAQITRYPDKEASAEGKITEVISRSGEAGGDIKALFRSYGLFQTFPSRVNAEAKAVSKDFLMRETQGGGYTGEEIGTREDLRNKTIITIDGADSKDFDDAVSVEKLTNGNFLLGVHIADVTQYVAEGGPMDKEALKRGNSVYLIDQVIPMLPKALSNGICSLNPDVDRYTLSVDMEIDEKGEVVNHRIYESVIHSKARMVYTDVSDMLEKKAVDLISKYHDLYDDILRMDELAVILRKKREARGSLDFDFDEAYITLDEQGIPVSVDIAERRVANKIIEEFMLLANETVAEHFYWLETPFVYRVHEKPAVDKIEEFKTFLRSFGIILKGDPENVHPKALNQILAQAAGKPYENVISTVMLRSMKKAFYDTECQGHFGLSFQYYCHFTSPIRRYPDLIIHRIIKMALRGEMDAKRRKAFKKKTREAAEIASATERKALELEREVEKLKKAEYMSYHVGKVYAGIISGVTGYGMYVGLENTIEGLVRIESLEDDFYDYDGARYRLIGRQTGHTYTLGDAVTIRVSSVSIENREINYLIAGESERQL